ncbi:MAG TPA: hydrogenase nickel incorporation protein HypB [Patescibacteria group bacterium]|nr:hydrogenase nickel incorporation protein HypB [Patescibacteria group bacterium]
MTQRITVVEKIMGANERIAKANREELDLANVYALNFMASPGAGKTSLIEQTLQKLASRGRVAVVDGDVATSIDADRAAAAGAQAIQINTGGECHLDAVMLQAALAKLDLSTIDLLIVENVGNLICPANFELGTHLSVLVASIPEGDDKPYKYPGMYQGVDALVINKIDLLPYIDFDMDYFRQGVEALNPGLVTFPLSCRVGTGLDLWLTWISEHLPSGNGS